MALFQFLVRGKIRAGDDVDAKGYLVDLLSDRAAGVLTPIEQFNITTWEQEEVAVGNRANSTVQNLSSKERNLQEKGEEAV